MGLFGHFYGFFTQRARKRWGWTGYAEIRNCPVFKNIPILSLSLSLKLLTKSENKSIIFKPKIVKKNSRNYFTKKK